MKNNTFSSQFPQLRLIEDAAEGILKADVMVVRSEEEN
jgi:hypothetical protein